MCELSGLGSAGALLSVLDAARHPPRPQEKTGFVVLAQINDGGVRSTSAVARVVCCSAKANLQTLVEIGTDYEKSNGFSSWRGNR
mgnify:CR=1 FL=1